MALGLCITYGLKNYLEKFDSMSSTLKDFVIEYTKNVTDATTVSRQIKQVRVLWLICQ